MRTPVPHRALRVLRGVGALIVLLVIVAGVPVFAVALQRATGLHVVPRSAPSLQGIGDALTRRDNGQLVAVILAAGVWICWALFTISLVPELVALMRRRPARPLPGLGGFQRSAGALVAAVAIGFTIAPVVGGVPAHANAAPPPLTRTASASSQAPPAAQAPWSAHPQSDGVTLAVPAPSASAPTYEVQRRDTLWGIAERFLHEPLRYTEIAHLNPTLIGPDHEITPGTLLTLPSDATGPGLYPAPTQGSGPRDVMVRVQAGDTLEQITQRVTGDGRTWPRAFDANQGRIEPGGERFTDPNLIKPGWTLAIPLARTATAPPAHDRTTPHSHTPPPATSTPANPAPPHTGRTASPAPTTPTPRPETPATRPTPSRAPTTRPSQTSSRSSHDTIAFAGGGALLAGVSLSALAMYRRRQFQRRRPGRVISSSPPALIEMERAVLTAGDAGLANVTWLDHAVRSLAQSSADLASNRLPDVIAVRMTDEDLTLILSDPAPEAPAPWVVNDDSTRWSIRRGDRLPYDPARRESYFAPYPTLASVGYTDSGEQWMLDLERVGALSLSGDAERCLNFGRFLAAELAHNTWAEMLRVTLVGFGQELVAANPDRLTYTADIPAAAAHATASLKQVEDALRSVGTDVLDGRLHDIVGDQWAPNVLLIAPDAAHDAAALSGLLAAIERQQARAAVALLLIDEPDHADRTKWHMTVDRDGTLRIPALDLTLTAHQLPAEEAAPLAQMLAYAAACDDKPIPPAHDAQPWDRYADACGGLIIPSAQTAPVDDAQSPVGPQDRGGHSAPVPVLHLAEAAPSRTNSILPLPPQTYLDKAATTRQDIQSLAPVVETRIRDQVEQADPGLDRDYAAWLDEDCPRPKVRLLGRPRVWAQGSLPETPQINFHTEAVALLSTRPRGLLSSEYAGLMWPNEPDVVGKPKVRKSIANVRMWLGRDDKTGEDHLRSVFEGRMARYLLPNVLRDAELFRRLRVRGVARGADGLEDLWKALALVDGPPFDQITIRDEAETDRGPGGWLWLTDANQRLDFEYQAMIVDTAHTVADRHLGAGEPESAAKAAQVALRAGAYDDVPLLDLVAACLAQEREAEAESYVRQLLSNSGVEREEDLQPRTAEVLFRMRRRWRDRAG